MDFAAAAAAAERGHEVTLVAGPVALGTPAGVRRVDVVNAREMLEATRRGLAGNEALVMAAAVADWRPKVCEAVKVKKSAMLPVIEIEPNPDILKTLLPLKGERVFVGFAAETGDPSAEARRKLYEKGLDLIVANDVSLPDAGFAVETNRVTLFGRDAEPVTLPLLSKLEVGCALIAWIERRGKR